jgi:3-isopropylmalate/(R)-2-methylmalate dehydratase small subunit
MFPLKKIEATALPLVGSDIDTDRIIPARFLKCVTFDGLGTHVFADDRFDETGNSRGHSLDDPKYKNAGILVVNKNFGCGSSREHAPQALQRFGFQALIGESFAEIFFGNCVALGIPCFTLSEEEVLMVQMKIKENPTLLLTIDLNSLKLMQGSHIYSLQMSSNVQNQFLSGHWDVTGLLLDNTPKIRQLATTLPYLDWRP